MTDDSEGSVCFDAEPNLSLCDWIGGNSAVGASGNGGNVFASCKWPPGVGESEELSRGPLERPCGLNIPG